MPNNKILSQLLQMRDAKYAAMQVKIIPNVSPDKIIGVRTPALRALAKTLMSGADTELFLSDLPHDYFEENQIHAFMISAEKNFDKCIAQSEKFLPFIDNWATCDQFSPRVFAKNREKLLSHIGMWIKSPHTYTIRFAIKMLMQHFLDDAFDIKYLNMVAAVKSPEYYVNMMRAWYFATALAKQYTATVPYLETRVLDTWTHNKTIQKCMESFRITPRQKQYLKTLKVTTS